MATEVLYAVRFDSGPLAGLFILTMWVSVGVLLVWGSVYSEKRCNRLIQQWANENGIKVVNVRGPTMMEYYRHASNTSRDPLHLTVIVDDERRTC